MIERPAEKEVIPTHTLFEEKFDNITGEIVSKARIVARGDKSKLKQQNWQTQLYSPVVSIVMVRLLLAIAAAYDLPVGQNDVRRAFLYSRRSTPTYLELPSGHKKRDGKTYVWRTYGITYGLLDAPIWWNNTLHNFLTEHGYQRSEAEACLYSKWNDKDFIWIVIHVDDMLYMATIKSLIKQFENELEARFELKKTEKPSTYLGMGLRWVQKGIMVTQDKYIQKMLEAFELDRSHPKPTPMETSLLLEKDSEMMQDKHLYQQMVGSLLYASGQTRVDISFAVNQLGTVMDGPSPCHLTYAKRVMKYLQGSRNFGLLYPRGMKKIKLEAQVDSDYANSKDRRSYTGYVILVNGTPIQWKTKKQKIVTLSSTEAEYVGYTMVAQELVWIQNVIHSTGVEMIDLPTKIYCDNESAITIAKGPAASGRTKHMDVRMHFIRQMIEKKRIVLIYRNTKELAADMLTKNLPRTAFEQHRRELMTDLSAQLRDGVVEAGADGTETGAAVSED